MNDVVIETNSLSKCYKLYRNPWHRAVEWGSLGKISKHEKYYALKDITFQVKRGRCLGIIGPNGAGKSTLLKILTGALHPTLGEFSVSGNVLSLLELGTGFNSELTGRQNLFNSAQIMGYPDEYIKDCIKEIEEFAELEEFLDRPIRIYSTGMLVRLAFSMFVSMKPQVLIIDEALSVGDVFFQQKSFAKMREIISSGTTCLFASHDAAAIQNLCDEAILLNHGEIEFMGVPEEVVNRYYNKIGKRATFKPKATPKPMEIPTTKVAQEVETEEASYSYSTMVPEEIIAHNILGQAKSRHGERGLEVVALRVTDKNGRDTLQVKMMETLSFYILLRANQYIDKPGTGIILTDRLGNTVFSAGNWNLQYKLPSMISGQELMVRFDLVLSVQPGKYAFSMGCHEPAAKEQGPNIGYMHDSHKMLGPIEVTATPNEMFPFYGIARLPMTVSHLSLHNKEL